MDTMPQSHAVRRRPSTPPVVMVLLALNAVVFLVWQLALRNQSLLELMSANFTVSAAHLLHGYFWTLLTAAFSHYELWHFLLNMMVLWSFGGPLAKLLGWRSFLGFYLVTAVFSSAAHCAVSALIMDRNVAALGASGAVSGLLLVYALLFPRHRILIMGVIPVPALVGVLGFVAFDIWGLVAQTGGGGLSIGHGAHLGGALCGALMYLVVLRPKVAELRRQVEGRRRPSALLSQEEAEHFERLRYKLNHEGPDALTPKEKEFLHRIRERVLSEE